VEGPYRDDRDERIARLEAENASLRAGVFTILDWIGLGVTGLAVLGLYLFPFRIGATFAAMFRDFGDSPALPAVTRLALRWWPPVVLAVALTAWLVVGLRRRSLRSRRVVLVALVLALAGWAFLVTALYLPIFSLAGAVRPG
jgi:hypothetical protein